MVAGEKIFQQGWSSTHACATAGKPPVGHPSRSEKKNSPCK
jgi:hypothetical protein